MAKTTKIIVAAAAAATGILIGGYIWLNSADGERGAQIDSGLTLEEQSPRLTPLSAVKSTGGSASDGDAVQQEAVQTDGNQTAAAQVSNADHETAAAAVSVEAETEEDAAEAADKQAAIDTFNAFNEAMKTFDIAKAQSMARGQAHTLLGLIGQAMVESDNITVKSSEKPPVNEFVYADGELRVIADGGMPTVLRKTDGEWHVESIPAFVSSSKTVKDEQGNVLDHVDTGSLPMTPENLALIAEIAADIETMTE